MRVSRQVHLLAVLVLAVAPAIAIPTALAPVASAAPSGPMQACMNGGWRSLTDVSGQPFKNQGQCIDYQIHNPAPLSDLANPSFTGTTSIEASSNGCSLFFQEFDATYPGSGTVGTVNLHVAGCIEPAGGSKVGEYSGSFSLTTAVGTVTGSAAGGVTIRVADDLTLTVGTATGAFSGMTGTLQFLATRPGFGFTTFSGTVTVP